MSKMAGSDPRVTDSSFQLQNSAMGTRGPEVGQRAQHVEHCDPGSTPSSTETEKTGSSWEGNAR